MHIVCQKFYYVGGPVPDNPQLFDIHNWFVKIEIEMPGFCFGMACSS